MRSRSAMVATTVGALAVGSAAVAQDFTRPSATRLQFGEWTFVAVVAQTGDSATVPGVLAMRDTSYATGNNIVSVWYENPGDCTSWTAKAWSMASQAEAVKYLKSTYSIADDWDWL